MKNVITTSSTIYRLNEYKVCYHKVVTRPIYKNNVSKGERKEKIQKVLTTSLIKININIPLNKNVLC